MTKLLTQFTLLIVSLSLGGIVADNSSTVIYSNTSLTGGARTAMPGCQTKCGDLIVPYPFGIGTDPSCSINPFFHIICNTSFNPPKAFLSSTEYEVLGISETELHIKNRLAWSCYDNQGSGPSGDIWMDLLGTPFSFSNENKLTVIGCDDVALVSKNDTEEWTDFISSCVAVCSKTEDLTDGFCSGIGCCQASIVKGLQAIFATLSTLNDHNYVNNFSTCGYAFLAEKNSYTFNKSDISDPSFASRMTETVPVVIDWMISNKNCNEVGNTEIVCQGQSVCVDSGSVLGGYRCNCSQGYQGNPYISPGCCSTSKYTFPRQNRQTSPYPI